METLAAPPGGGPAGIATIHPAVRLRGELSLPGDKSISHRALMLALLAAGESRIHGAGDGADVRSTAGIARALGATVDRVAGDGRTVDYRVVSPGVDALRQPPGVLDCGNSGTSLRLFAGILAGVPLTAVLDGDASLRRRPVARIIEPLRAMGATLRALDHDSLPPVTVTGHRPLRPIDWTTPVPSAQVKSAILFAGLRAGGTTRVRERVATRDHSERMLRARGVSVRSLPDGEGGAVIEIEGGTTVQAMDERVPGDPSAAAFWLVAGLIHPDAELHIRAVGVNPTRRAVIDLLTRMGGRIEERPVGGSHGGRRGWRASESQSPTWSCGARISGRSTSFRPRSPRRSTRSRSSASRRRRPGAERRSAARASCATRSPIGWPVSRPASAPSAPVSRSTATTSRSTGPSASSEPPRTAWTTTGSR